jgi:hypothetical protein
MEHYQKTEEPHRMLRKIDLVLAAIIVVALLFALIVTIREVISLREQLMQQKHQIELVTQAYVEEMKTNKKLLEDRQAAAEAVKYTKQTDVDHQVSMLGDFFSFIGQSRELRKKMENTDFNDPKQADEYAKDLNAIMEKGLGTLTRIMLHNTEEPEANKTK